MTEARNKFGEGENWTKALESAQSYMKKYPKAEDIPDSQLPQQFDWRDVKGYDFTSKIRD